MTNFTGYTFLGSIDLSDDTYDLERELSVYRDEAGALFTLDASGCICCGDLNDGLTVDDLDAVNSVGDLAELLVKELNENGWGSEDAETVRTILRAAAAGVPVTTPLALN